MKPKDLAHIKALAQKHGIELKDHELVCLMGVVESCVQTGIEQIEAQIKTIESGALVENNTEKSMINT